MAQYVDLDCRDSMIDTHIFTTSKRGMLWTCDLSAKEARVLRKKQDSTRLFRLQRSPRLPYRFVFASLVLFLRSALVVVIPVVLVHLVGGRFVPSRGRAYRLPFHGTPKDIYQEMSVT